MSGNLNVDRSNPDPFYRYKMPSLITKVEGRGNGIKTVVVNMGDIARALDRPPQYTCKFFGCELGAQTILDDKNDRYIVNGQHEQARLAELLDVFIRKFVLCQQCNNPETRMSIDKKQMIHADCAACGHQYLMDNRHKLCTFILKNPPDFFVGKGATPAGGKGSKKDRRAAKVEKQKSRASGAASGATNAIIDPNDVPPEVHINDDDLEWSEDTSDEAVAKRRAAVGKDLAHGMKHFQIEDLDDLSDDDRLGKLYTYLQTRLSDPSLTHKDIIEYADMLEVNEKAIGIIGELMLDADVLTKLDELAPLLRHFLTKKKAKAEKYLLGAIEILVGNRSKEALLKRTPLILKAFYERDLLSEEVLLAWSEKPSKKYVKKDVSIAIHDAAEPFVKWLKEAEEEESDEDDDEDDFVIADGADIEVAVDDLPVDEEDNDDDLDIDNI